MSNKELLIPKSQYLIPNELVHIKELKLTQFKNYESEQFVFSEHLNCILGKNGMGKTNLLDAIYYLCMTKSHFGMTDRHLVLQGETFFRLEGHFVRKEKKEKIVSKVIPSKQKTFERNDVAYHKLSDHVGLLPIVMIAPDDTMLAREGSEVRRKFIDNTLSQQDNEYLNCLIQYNKVLKQRNAALKQFAETNQFDYSLITTYNRQLAHPAAVIHDQRSRFIEQFYPVFQAYYRAISNAQEHVNCTYQSKLSETDLLTLLDQAIEKDRALQRTTVGIHKDDLIFTIEDFPLKRFASQGQLKSYILALKLAQYEFLRRQKKISPILLLDDLFDKLDSHRVRQLLELLFNEAFGQVFITDTDETRIEKIMLDMGASFKKFMIEEGKLI